MSPQPQTPPPHAAVLQILGARSVGAVISCIAKLGIPDLLEAGPMTADALASEIGAHPGALYRLMRAAASAGVLAEDAQGKFSQTPMSAVLRTHAIPSLRGWAIMNSMEMMIHGWEQLEYSVRTGKPAIEKVYGAPVFQYLKEHPDEARIFNEGMTALSMLDSAPIADAYSFEGIHSIVDVAGGHGLLLATILQRRPQMKGTLYEVASVIAGVADGPLAPMMDRCTLASGDMFTAMPAGHDAYIMKHIIHDWPDEACVKILQGCRKGVNAGGKLLVADSVIKPGNDPDFAKLLDIDMLLFPGGHERTELQFRELFAKSGWRLNRIVPTLSSVSIVEGVPA